MPSRSSSSRFLPWVVSNPLRRPTLQVWTLFLVTGVLVFSNFGLQAQDDSEPVAVRILPILDDTVRGKVEVETLVIDPDLRQLVFYLDGEKASSRNRPPWNAKVTVAEPPREQKLRVEALGPGDKVLGHDTLIINRYDPPFRVQITAIEGDAAAGDVVLRGQVTLPRHGVLESVDVLLNDVSVAQVQTTELEVPIRFNDPKPEDVVQVVATLEDGRKREDLEILRAPGFVDFDTRYAFVRDHPAVRPVYASAVDPRKF